MKKNNSRGPSSKSPSRFSGRTPSGAPTKKVERPAQFMGLSAGKTKDKSFYPKSWRQVAGTHAIAELLQVHPKSVELVLVQANWRSSADLRQLMEILEKKKVKIEEKSETQLNELCRSHQGAVAFSSSNLEFNWQGQSWGAHGLIVALDGVEDTQNLGAILRTSWLMGVDGMIIPEDRAVGLTATVHKVACGGAEHVPIYRSNQFAAPFETLKKAGFWVFGLSHKASKTIYDLNIPEKIIWAMGAEDKGLRIPTEKACDELVCIPQISPQASYNVSVATAIALAETKRQWSAQK